MSTKTCKAPRIYILIVPDYESATGKLTLCDIIFNRVSVYIDAGNSRTRLNC